MDGSTAVTALAAAAHTLPPTCHPPQGVQGGAFIRRGQGVASGKVIGEGEARKTAHPNKLGPDGPLHGAKGGGVAGKAGPCAWPSIEAQKSTVTRQNRRAWWQVEAKSRGQLQEKCQPGGKKGADGGKSGRRTCASPAGQVGANAGR